MKKLKPLFPILISIFLISSCSNQKDQREISCEEVIEVYRDQGYEVTHSENTVISECLCMVKVMKNDSDDYILFHFFSSNKTAEEYKKKNEMNPLIYFFSCIFGEKRWLNVVVYNTIEIEYLDKELYEPFKSLI